MFGESNLTIRRLQVAQKGSYQITPAADPLGASVSLPFHVNLFPFGFLTRIRSNDPTVVRIAEQSWASSRSRFPGRPLELRFWVSRSPMTRCPPRLAFRAQNNLLTGVADSRNFACCDLATGFGVAHLIEAAVRDQSYFRYNFLEAMVYTLLDALHVVAIHAACLVKEGRGFLFVGDSGAGKSSLAYACARRGWTYVSDDCSAIIRRRTGRVAVGNPRSFRFRPAVSTLFPEVEGRISFRNGKRTIEIETGHLPFINTAAECTISHVVFLNRSVQGGGTARLEVLSQRESFSRLSQQNAWPPELRIEEERQATIESLLDAQLLQLTYKDCDSAIEVLEQTIQSPAA